MPKSIGAFSRSAEDEDAAEFTSIAPFSGVGALISLVVLILRIRGIF
ncbi:hypothetical protein ES703_72397 [subsurface metagenome]